MKNLFLLLFVCLITFETFGQSKVAPSEQMIGKTKYDTQTNKSFGSRFHRFDDGRMVATWTGGMQDDAFPDRGSFYNYFNGTIWTENPNNIYRIEDDRAGWPSWAPLGNGEVIASHDATTVNLWTRASVGTGMWTKKSTLSGGNVWPRICVNDGVIHLITTENMTENTLWYSKSTDGGETWNPQRVAINTVLPDYDYNPGCYSADSYVWAEPVNGIIALSLCGRNGDLVIYKSANNGTTWEKKVAWLTPVKNQTTFDDYVYAPVAQSLVIDNDGKCHLAFTVGVAQTNTSALSYYSYAYYWNEDMPAFSNSYQYVALDPDENPQYAEDGRLVLSMSFIGDEILDYIENLVLYSPFGAIHKVHMAAAGPNRMILVFAIQDHTTMWAGQYFFSRIFACSYKKTGNVWVFDTTWSDDITNWGHPGWLRVNKDIHTNENCTHPQVVVEKTADDSGKFHIFYMVDDMPGSAIEGPASGDNNPQYGYYTNNYFVVYSDDVNVPGGGIPPTITTNSLPDGKEGNTYSQTLTAIGTNPISWTVESGTLPDGLSLVGATITGTPTKQYGTFEFTVKANNNFGFDTKDLSIFIDTIVLVPPTITTNSLPNGKEGNTYSQTLTATGSTPITWNIENGTLPDGLNLIGAAITGTPTKQYGTFEFTVKATNAVGYATKDLSIFIDSIVTVVPPFITTTNLPNGKKGVDYYQTLMAEGTQPITWSIVGNLPEGLTFANSGVISGTPTKDDVEPTVYTFNVKATNEIGADEKELSITIDAGVGIDVFETSPIKVYPNPANDKLYIIYDNQQSMQVKLFDFMGREVMNQNITDKTGIDISKLPAGIYNLNIIYGNTIENRKIVKN